jgi:UPF0271 protein
MRSLPINCDLAEGFGPYQLADDLELIPFVDQCNIAGGQHAGDFNHIAKCVSLATKLGKEIGVHPGYPDRRNFGRLPIHWSLEESENCLIQQISIVAGFSQYFGSDISFVKPHGHWYHLLDQDRDSAVSFITTIQGINDQLAIVGLEGGLCQSICSELNQPFRSEVFLDRTYKNKSQLVSRNQPNAVISDRKVVLDRYNSLITSETVSTIEGKEVWFNRIDTLCIHSDTPVAFGLLKYLALNRKDDPQETSNN